MVEFSNLNLRHIATSKSGQGKLPVNGTYYLHATGHEREVIETNAPFLIDCHGTYQDIEAQAAALAFNFTEK